MPTEKQNKWNSKARIIPLIAVAVISAWLAFQRVQDREDTSVASTPKDEISEMKFTLYRADMRPAFDLIQVIYADGVITEGSSDLLLKLIKEKGLIPQAKVVFNSPGGSLKEGMKLGEIIRQNGFYTDVGRRGPPVTDGNIEAAKKFQKETGATDLYPPESLEGVCLSACSLAYLGGVHRYIHKGSMYGVHRFSSKEAMSDPLDTAQIISGVIVRYLKEMGIDPLLFTIMSVASSNEIIPIEGEDLTHLRVLTGSSLKDEWVLKSTAEFIYLLGTHIDERGTSKLMFVCKTPSKQLEAVMYLPEHSIQGATEVIAETINAGIFLDGEIRPISKKNKLRLSQNYDEVQAMWTVLPQDMVDFVSAKRSIGFALLPKVPGLYFGMEISFGEQGREMLGNYAANCWKDG